MRRGLIYTDCGEVIYQGFSCLECKHATLIRCSREEPIVDVTDFILQPRSTPFNNIKEILWLTRKTFHPECYLKFKTLPAWRDGQRPSYPTTLQDVLYSYDEVVTLFANEDDVERRRFQENQTGLIKLRRLYLDIPFYRCLLTLSSNNQVTNEYETGFSDAYSSLEEIKERNKSIIHLNEFADNKTIRQCIEFEMKEMGALTINEDDYANVYDTNISYNYWTKYDILNISEHIKTVGWEDTILNKININEKITEIVEGILQELPYRKARIELKKWITKKKTGIALFVDAPMGFGKSYSVFDILSNSPSVSACIFMPTIDLCKEMSVKLRESISRKNKNHFSNNFNGIISESEGLNFPSIYSNEYMKDEVYFVEGINKDDCLFYVEIIDGYRRRWGRKSSYCRNCPKNNANDSCKFLKWVSEACKARIIVATHKLYDVFNKNELLHHWEIEGEDKKRLRDVFIVDEDLVMNNCYAPIVLKIDEIINSCSTFADFLSANFANHEQNKYISDNINMLLGLIIKPGKSAVIPPIDIKFEISIDIRKSWEGSNRIIGAYLPDYIESNELVFNLLDVIEHGIKYGVVVQKYYPKNEVLSVDSRINVMHAVYFPNPKKYDLCGRPPHVFFDGTKINNKFLSKKLHGVEFEPFEIENEIFRKHKIYQNINTDLPSSKIVAEREKVIKFLIDILLENGKGKKYFIHTTKAIRENYLNTFRGLMDEYDIKIEHYGNLRGKNLAKDCNIHIMLGSFAPPDTFEIALGLEFMQQELIGKEPLSTRYKFWDFQGSNSMKKYKSGYEVIEELSKAYRHAEQRQALARTRYIYHLVTFYILAKEPVHEYEPSLPEPITCQYRDDLFPPRKQQGDAKYERIKDEIVKALTLPDGNGEIKNKVCDFDIHKLTGIHRATVKKYRKQLVEEGFLVKIKTRFYKLSS